MRYGDSDAECDASVDCADVNSLPAGSGGEFRTNLNTQMAAVEDKAQLAVGCLEALQAAIGNGALSGGAITAGVGLSVSVAAFTALIGTWIGTDAATIVGGLANGAVNSIFARQDGTFTANTTGTKPAGDGHGDGLLWGTAATVSGAVTAVTNVRRTFAQRLAHFPVVTANPAEVADGDAWILESGSTHEFRWKAAGTVYKIAGT